MTLRPDSAQFLGLKNVIEDVFGRDAWYKIQETTDIIVWKKYFCKVIDVLEISALENIATADSAYHTEISNINSEFKQKSELQNEICELIASFSVATTKIAFLGMGDIPKNKLTEKVTKAKHHWRLDSKRSVFHTSTREQRNAAFIEKNGGDGKNFDIISRYLSSKSTLDLEDWIRLNDPGFQIKS